MTQFAPIPALVFQLNSDQFRALRLGDSRFWLHPTTPSGLFTAVINDTPYTALNLPCTEVESSSEDEVKLLTAHFSAPAFQVAYHVHCYPNSSLVEFYQTIHNTSPDVIHLSRLDSLSWHLPPDTYDLFYYTSDWGQEFESIRAPLSGEIILETRCGRSSKGHHPWFALFDPSGSVLSTAVAWSGNWVFRFNALSDGGYHLSGGLHDWAFAQDLRPGQSMDTPPVILVLGHDLNAVSQQYARIGRRYWYPRNELSTRLPVEWNHWFSYEDTDINDAVFTANVSEAASLGVEACALDAGWFGPTDPQAAWHDYRGDWSLVNEIRFPRGIRPLSDDTHAHAMSFGFWCEIEGLGKHAALISDHPDFVAAHQDQSLGYICFANPRVQDWAYETLCRLISTYNCDWIKLDFNVDPGAGCTRTDHGHGALDGLYEHYQGYYRTLDRLRQTYPHVVFENCSSGGLRIDLGMLRHTHMTFLSDPDWPVHDLQIFWGATTMLAPDVCLHWSYSEWRGAHPHQNFDPRDPHLQPHQLDYYTRISMLGWFGLCQKLPLLPVWVKTRLATHIHIYQTHVRRFVREADLYRLTDQPRRDGSGDRWCAFQYTLPGDEHLLFVFRLPGAEPTRTIHLFGLHPDRRYHVTGFEGETYPALTAPSDITFADLPEESSALLHVIPS